VSAIKIGNDSVDLKGSAQLYQPDEVSVRFDANHLRPIFVPRDSMETILLNLGLAQVLRAEPKEHKGKKWANYLREAGQSAGVVLEKIVTHPDFTSGKGVVVGYIPQIDEDQEEEEEQEQE